MKNIVLCYEPGAGGDFLATLLSYSYDIFGDNVVVDFHSNGRIKSSGSLYISHIDDYEYTHNFDTLSDLMCYQNFNTILSKVHPYITRDVSAFEYKLNDRYANSIKIMLHRNPKICYLNDQFKNADVPMVKSSENLIEHYNDEWYSLYNKIKINTDIIDIQFEDILTSPIRTLASICEYADIRPNISNGLINTYKKYVSNQMYIEDVKRFWK